MAEETSTDGSKPTPPEMRTLVTPADLAAVDFEAPIRDLDVADAHGFYIAYEQAYARAREANDEAAQIVYRLFGHLCGIMLNTSDPGNVWGPLMVLTNGQRSAIPDDFRGEQTATLAAIVNLIGNPALRARMADIAWSNNRKDGASAVVAIDAYCASVAGLLDGSLKTSHGISPLWDAVPPLRRAIQIATSSTKRSKRPPKVAETFEALYAVAREQADVSTFVKLIEMGMPFGLRTPAEAAPELEAVAAAVPEGTLPVAIKQAWNLAAQIYHNLGNKEARQRCLTAAVEQTLAMRGQVSTPAAEASWVNDALQELRHIDGKEELKGELERELRRLQQASLKQMATFSIDLKVGPAREAITEHFMQLSLSESLKSFALLTHSRDPAELREKALENARASPLLSLMSGAHLDNQGRIDARSPGAPMKGEPDDVWYRREIGRQERLHRVQIVAAAIDPARLAIQARFGISERHFRAIIGLSAFVPDSQKPIIALGFARFFQGDMMSATHLLIPQLEPCLRHLLKINGHDPSKRRDDNTEEDLALGGLYSRFRTELDKILTPALASEIDLLFNAKPGPELRHELAHGQISAGACFDAELYYANWLIFHVCCLFVIEGWDEFVTPQLIRDE